MAETFIDRSEQIIDDVAEWGVEYIKLVVDALAPNGRPFGMERRSKRDHLREYMTTLRGNPLAWREWVNERAARIVTLLQEAGVPDEQIAQVHPFSIAESYAVKYSAQMEKVLEKEEERAREETLRPLPSLEEEEGDEWSSISTSSDGDL